MIFRKLLIICASLLALTPGLASAHQPRIVVGNQVIVSDPEISKAYYGQLRGEPQIYHLTATTSFNLYVNVLVPDIEGQKKDVSAVVLKNGDTENPLVVLNGTDFSWNRFWEPFGYDWYWKGPEYKAQAGPGEYEIRVWSSNNDSKYSLAIGELEAFDFRESVNALRLIPRIKNSFFNESPAGFIFSPFGWGYILVMFILAFLFGFIYRFLLNSFALHSPRQAKKNIKYPDRFIRIIIGIGLFLWAVTTTWNPLLLFFSGFSFFEAIFSWCGFYAAIGRNTCPVE